MVKKGNAVDANLLNFHFSSSPPPQQQQSRPRSGSFNSKRHNGNNGNSRGGGGNNNSRSNKKDYRSTAEDRTSARRKAASNMFPLHSSPDHAFVISRHRANNTTSSSIHNGNYTFDGPDSAVSWESVRIVKYLVSLDQLETSTVCPICLDTFTVLRITKCGHCFCLPCLIHHVQSFADKTYAPKCPCCAIPLHLQDVRPVQIVHVKHTTPPAVKSTVRFVKLHRVKDCPTPYLPHASHPRRSSPHAAPGVIDADAAYCKFNYVDMPSYQRLLEENIQELLQLESSSGNNVSTLEAMCLGTAVQMIQDDLNRCAQDGMAELALQQQFQNPAAGMYQEQAAYLQFTHHQCDHTIPGPAAAATLEQQHSTMAYSSSWDDIPSSPPSSSGDHDHAASHHLSVTTDENYRTSQGDECNDEIPSSPLRRGRGDSISSYGGMSACSDSSTGRQTGATTSMAVGGSMYAHEDEYAFYQDEDGSLCFLSGFNMLCLQAEYSTTRQSTDSSLSSMSSTHGGSGFSPPTSPPHQPLSPVESTQRPPLPDVIEGKVLEVERIHLTADIRQRRRFLSHIPLHVDICLIEIGIGHVLSHRTKQQFKKEFQKRNQKRLLKETAEKRSDERMKRQEEERINELKCRIQRIDPNDEFFQPVSLPDPEPNLTGEDFGPSLPGLQHAESRSTNLSSNPDQARRSAPVSFSQVCRTGDAFPSLSSVATEPTEENFPALGSSPPTTKRAPPSRPWGSTAKSSSAAGVASDDAVVASGGKKGKGKKIVLFSTGGCRGDYS